MGDAGGKFVRGVPVAVAGEQAGVAELAGHGLGLLVGGCVVVGASDHERGGRARGVRDAAAVGVLPGREGAADGVEERVREVRRVGQHRREVAPVGAAAPG